MEKQEEMHKQGGGKTRLKGGINKTIQNRMDAFLLGFFLEEVKEKGGRKELSSG